MSKNLPIEENKEKIIQTKFASTKNIEKIKADLLKSREMLKIEIQKSKNANKELTKNIKGEKNKFDNRLKKEKIKNNIETTNQWSIIKNNQSLIRELRKTMKSKAKLFNSKNKAIVIENRRDIASDKMEVSKSLAEAKSKYKIDITNLKSIREKKKLDVKSKLHKYKNELESENNKRQKIIDDKIKELNKNKVDLKIQRLSAIKKMKELHNEKKLAIKSMSIELKKELELKGKISQNDILNIKLETQDMIKDIKTNHYKDQIENIKIQNEVDNEAIKKRKVLEQIEQNLLKSKKSIKKTIADNSSNTKVMLEVDIEDIPTFDNADIIRGNTIAVVKKSHFKLFNSLNKMTSKISLSKIKLPEDYIRMIEDFRYKKTQNQITDIRAFLEYTNLVTNLNIGLKELDAKLISVIIAMSKGKVLSFINNYFWIQKVKGLKIVMTSKQLPKSIDKVLSLGEDKFTQKFEKIICQKIKSGLYLKLMENIAITYKGKDIVVITDTPFMR